MVRAPVLCLLCAVLSSSWLENVDAQLSSEHDSGSIIQSIETLSRVVEHLQTEIKKQSSVLNNMVSKEELKSLLMKHLPTKSDMRIYATSFKNLEAKAAMHDHSLSNLQATLDELKTLLINSDVKEDKLVTCLKTLEAQSNMQTVKLNNFGANLENQTSWPNKFLTKEETQMNNLTNEVAKITAECDRVPTSGGRIQNSTASKGIIVQGIIAGTDDGVFIIPLSSREPRKISTKITHGVAFNWQSRKVYWIHLGAGIKTAQLDGSYTELLVSDESYLRGLAVDQITGNLYYGGAGSNPRIRVCDSRGKKCVTIVSGVNHVGNDIYDIVLFPSEGLMFWSSPWDKETVTQANMDGTNATVIISENVSGLYFDEFKEKLYWVNFDSGIIGRYDLNGDRQQIYLNTAKEPQDIAVDGDTIYFSSSYPTGVYSVTNKTAKVSSILNTTEDVDYIALYGRNKVFSRSNPCSNSPCANLCVLTRVSYTCL